MKALKQLQQTNLDICFDVSLPGCESINYTPAGREAKSFVVNLIEPDPTINAVHAPADEMEVAIRHSDVSEVKKQDTFILDSETWYVKRIIEGPQASGMWRIVASRAKKRRV